VARVIDVMICLGPEDLKELDACARKRGCSRSAEIRFLLHERHHGEDPRVTAARYYAEAKEHERIGREARAKASIERSHCMQVTASLKTNERLTLAAMSPAKPSVVHPTSETTG